MAFRIGSAFIQLSLKGVNKVLGNLKSIGRGFVNFGKQIAKVGLVVGGVLATFAIIAIKTAADAEESLDAFVKTFGKLEPVATKFANNLAEALGRSKIEIKESLTDFQAFAKGLGLADKEAFKFSKTAARLAIDLASFRNLQDVESQERFIAALSGSGETLIKFGINVKEAALNEFLLAEGFKKGSRGANEQQKAVARLAVIMRDMGRQDGAIGNAAATAGSFTNQLKALKAEVKDATIDIGTKLLPVATKVVAAFRSSLPAIAAFGNNVGTMLANVLSNFDKFRVGIVNFTINVQIQWLQLQKGIIDGIDLMINGFVRWGKVVQQIAKTIGDAFSGMADVIGEAIKNSLDAIEEKLGFVPFIVRKKQAVGRRRKGASPLGERGGGIEAALLRADDRNKRNLSKLGDLFSTSLFGPESAGSKLFRKQIRELRSQLETVAKPGGPGVLAPEIEKLELPDIPGGGKAEAEKRDKSFAKGFEGVESLFRRLQTQIAGEAIDRQILNEDKKQTKLAEERNKVLKGMAEDIGRAVQTNVAVTAP